MNSLVLSIVLVGSMSLLVAGGPAVLRAWRRTTQRHAPSLVLAALRRRERSAPQRRDTAPRAHETVERALLLAELRRGG
jgi:hypothetical protein